MLIEILGSSGSGKTTIKKDILNQLRSSGVTCYDAEIGGSFCSNVKIICLELLWHPWLLPMACYLGFRKGGRHGVMHWLRCLVRSVHIRRQIQFQGGVFLIDQDVISSMSRTPNIPPFVIHRLPLPDIVIEVRADAAARQKRRIMRQQLPSHLTCGQQRLIQGRHAAALLSDSCRSELPALMNRWNERFCSPRLTPEQLNQVIQDGLSMASSLSEADIFRPQGVLWWAMRNGKQTILSDAEAYLIRQRLEQRGLKWWTVDNGLQSDLSEIVASLTERIAEKFKYPLQMSDTGSKDVALSENKAGVTLFINSLQGGGAEQVCLTLANGLKQKGWNVNLLVLNLKDAVLQDQLDPEITMTDMKISHARMAIVQIAKYIKQSKPPVILVFNPQLAVVLVLIRKLCRLKFTIICRNINTLSRKKQDQKNLWHRYIADGLIRFFLRGVDRMICQSQGMADDLAENYAIAPPKITVIYNPLNPGIEDVAAAVDWAHIQKKDFFLCVGRLESQKAFHYAIEAFSRVAASHPAVRLKILGQGSLEAQLKQLARKLQVSDRVDFMGFQKEISAYYIEARATLLTSLYEGFPNVLIESLALGTPVVAFDCPSGPREIICEGQNGFLAEYLNIEDFAQKLSAVLRDKNFDPRTVRQTAEKYSSKKIISQYESVLKSVSASNGVV